MNNPLISVIIPTYNSEKTLRSCLSSIKNQSYKNIEVIVVDNFSHDNTVILAKKNDAFIYLLEAERAEAKNFGFLKTAGEFVLFIDSDMELTEHVVKECVDLIESDLGIAGIVIPERSIGDSYWVQVRDFERSFYTGTVIESARFFRKKIIEEVGGFEAGLVSYEESTLPQKIENLGYDVSARIEAKIFHLEYDFSLSRWLKKKYYYGKTSKKYKNQFSIYGNKQFSLSYRLSLFLLKLNFYSKPRLAIGVLFLKLLEYGVILCSYITYNSS